MKRFPFLPVLLLSLALCFLAGCQSPRQEAGSANRETRVETSKVESRVTSAQAHNAKADEATTEVANDPRLPQDLRAKLVTAHGEHAAVADALKPIVPDLLPRINAAADRALEAELRAQDAANGRIKLYILLLVFAVATYGFRKDLGFGWGISGILGGAAALGVMMVMGELARYVPWLVWIGFAGVVVYVVEACYKGGLFKGGLAAAFHDVWHDAARAAKAVPAELVQLKQQVEWMAAAAAAEKVAAVPAAPAQA